MNGQFIAPLKRFSLYSFVYAAFLL